MYNMLPYDVLLGSASNGLDATQIFYQKVISKEEMCIDFLKCKQEKGH